jgi:glycosyltransferase involved in cell wall biosynthesis
MIRVAYLVSHPIQYQAPLLRLVARQPDFSLKVLFGANTAAGTHDPGFGVGVRWDVPLLEGYPHEFLPALANGAITNFRPLNMGLGRRLKQGGFDVLWVHGYTRPAHILAIIAAKRLGIKVMVRDESHGANVRRSGPREHARRAFYAFLTRTVDAFLAIGSLNHDYYRRLGVPEERIFSVPYAVDNEFFQGRTAQATRNREELRRNLQLAPGRPIVLFAGKLIERKGAMTLLEAYRRLSPDGRSEPEPYLLFAGDGEQRGAIEKFSADIGWESIRVLGFRNQTELPALYDLCDLFVLPSSYEPWGLVVNEVMNAGKAVIVSNRVGCGPDLVKPGVNGAVFPAGDAQALATAMAAVLRDRDALGRMGEKSRKIIEGWSFNEDLAGIRTALDYLTGSAP